jgi:hypothetical protein
VFAGGDHIAQFDPDQDMSAEMCRVATEYASYVIFRANPGYNIFSSVMYDGLTARAGVAKIYWEKKHTYSEETFEGLQYEEAHALAAQEDVDEFNADLDPATGTFAGTLSRKKDVSKTCIDPIAPEEFLIEPLATCILDAKFCGHRTPKTRAELIEMGIKKSIVDKLPADEAKELQFSPEVLARNNPTHSNDADNDAIDASQEFIVLYESYVRMEIDSSKGARLYKVLHAGGKLLEDPEEVDKAPFLAYVPLPLPHVFYGHNFAARVIHTQNARTVLFRGVLDHTAITTNPRYAVVNGGLMNPRELLDNRLGGIVNVRRPDSVAPFVQNNLNPYVFNVLGTLTENNEKSTGISALSQGLNKDAISTQNSKGLVDNMMKASGGRSKIMARNFAFNFLVPLMLEVVRLGIIYKDKRVIQVAGAPLQIDAERGPSARPAPSPSTWATARRTWRPTSWPWATKRWLVIPASAECSDRSSALRCCTTSASSRASLASPPTSIPTRSLRVPTRSRFASWTSRRRQSTPPWHLSTSSRLRTTASTLRPSPSWSRVLRRSTSTRSTWTAPTTAKTPIRLPASNWVKSSSTSSGRRSRPQSALLRATQRPRLHSPKQEARNAHLRLQQDLGYAQAHPGDRSRSYPRTPYGQLNGHGGSRPRRGRCYSSSPVAGTHCVLAHGQRRGLADVHGSAWAGTGSFRPRA